MYKEKVCPVCSVKHRKRGVYCCQSHANMDREASDRMRDNMRQVSQEYKRTPEGLANMRLSEGLPRPSEDYAIQIPDFPDLPDGYDRGENW